MVGARARGDACGVTTHAAPLPAVRRPSRPRTGLRALLGGLAGGPARVAPALPAQRVQALLLAHGLLDARDLSGRYDRATCDAVARFQAAHGLVVDGIPGRATADALLA